MEESKKLEEEKEEGKEEETPDAPPSLPPLEAAARRLERLLGAVSWVWMMMQC